MRILCVFAFLILFNTDSFTQPYWSIVSDNIPDLQVLTIQFTSDKTGYACGHGMNWLPGAIFKTTNGGTNWQVTHFQSFEIVDLSFLDDNTGYFAAWHPDRRFVYKTTDGGNNWICADTLQASFFKIKFYDYNIGMIASKYSISSFTSDGGSSWITYYNGYWYEPTSLICLNKDTWMVSDNYRGINKTTNAGLNWIYMDFNNIGLSGLSLYFLNDTAGFNLSYNGKVFKTENRGSNWTEISAIPYTWYYSKLMFPNPNTGYILHYDGIYRSSNGGYNWTKQKIDSTQNLYSVYFINSDTGFVGGDNGRIYRTTTGGVAFIPPKLVPENYAISQNYPNPFNSSTRIKYDIPVKCYVNITIYDITGRRIKTLVDTDLQPGYYEVDFNSTELSSGIYFYKLLTNDYSETKKMVLVK